MLTRFIKRHKRMKCESGFSLLELLFVIGVSSVILLGSVRMADSWAEDLRDLKEAQYIKTVMDAAQLYVQNNFDRIWEDPLLMNEAAPTVNIDGTLTWNLNNPGRVLRLGLNAPSNGRPADFFLQDPVDGTLRPQFPLQSPLSFEPKIYVRNNGISPVQETRTLELFVITDTNNAFMLPVSRANNVASKLGPEAGVYSRINPDGSVFAGGFCTAGNIVRSLFGLWEITADMLTGANTPNTDNEYCPATQPGPDGRGGYVIVRRVIEDKNEIINDVLYRVNIDGRPKANQMQANLNMNNNGIQGANIMSADKLIITGNMDLSASNTIFYVEETGRFAGAGSRVLAVPVGVGSPDPDCFWNDVNSPTRALNPAATGPCDLRGGNLTVAGTPAIAGRNALTADQLNAPFSTLSSQRLQASNINVNGTALYNSTSTIAQAEVGGLVSSDVTVNGNIQTQSLQSGNMDVSGTPIVGSLVSQYVQMPQIAVGDLQVNRDSDGTKGNIQINGALALNNGLNADQARFVNITNCQTNIITRFDLDADGNRYEVPDDRENVATYDCVLGP